MKWIIADDYEALSLAAARMLLDALEAKPDIVLGLPTGRTPERMYERVVSECRSRYRCFSGVTTFNLDEYVGIPPEHPGSYATYVREHLVRHVEISPDRVHIPEGTAATVLSSSAYLTFREALERECERYEQLITDAGGLELTFLGLGRNGHIGFNEPGAAFDSRTRVVQLTESTRAANAPHFPDGDVPEEALTMGIATILSSRRIVLLASGSAKHDAVERLASGELDIDFPASALNLHDDVTVIADRAAAAGTPHLPEQR